MKMKRAVCLLPGFFLAPSAVLACSTCMVGDPTLTLMGVEKPFENRLRMSVEYLRRDEELGREGVNLKEIDESRYTLNVAYAPSRRWMLGVSIPWVERELSTFNLADADASALGDISLNVKGFLQSGENARKNLYGVLAGVRLPTAEEQKDNGTALDFDVQPGTGATAVNLGAWYSRFSYPFMFYASTFYQVSDEGFQDFQAGDAWVLNAGVQYASDYKLAFQLGFEGRWSEKDEFDSVKDPDSGGTIGFLAPGLVYTLRQDLLINMAVKFPVLDQLNGDHEEGTIYTIGVTYDFNLH